VSLDVGSSDRVAVFGPNGAGKSILLRTIAGTVPGAQRRDDVAYLPQTPYLFRGTAGFNLTLGADDPSRARDFARALGVGDLLEQDSSILSGGERQRIAIARVLSGTERLVLLDEPLAPIDIVDRQQVISTIREATTNRALLCVTHSVELAAALAEKLVVLDGGRVVQEGTVHDVLAAPSNDRVADLVGVSNLINGTVTGRDGDIAAVTCGSAILFVVTDAPISSKIVVRIGAATIAVYGQSPEGASHRNVIAGTVRSVVEQGTLIEIGMDGDPGFVALVTPGALDALGIETGSSVWFGIKTAAITVVAVR
jgi:molybdate transport system ATP-binding protein